jgi:hypothetical protein
MVMMSVGTCWLVLTVQKSKSGGFICWFVVYLTTLLIYKATWRWIKECLKNNK